MKVNVYFLFFIDRQHWWSYWQLPWHPPHRLEGLPASAVCSAGNCSVCCGGSCGFPEETGEEQEVLLRREEKNLIREVLWNELLSRWQIEHTQCEFFFSKDCTNVYLWSTALRVNCGDLWCLWEGAELMATIMSARDKCCFCVQSLQGYNRFSVFYKLWRLSFATS